jgi:hypothetical protein
MSAWSLILLFAVAGALWFWVSARGHRPAAEQELRRLCFGDERQTERLIQGELARTPGISRGEAARRAVERHRRDNR